MPTFDMEFSTKLKLPLLIGVLGCLCRVWCANEQCIDGLYHLEKPSNEPKTYKVCTPWQNLTCCNAQLDNEVHKGDSPVKYNSSWHSCGNLSNECLKFWQHQECFYQCSPYVYKWQSLTNKDAIEGVPICADQCDEWYNACKDDRICVEDLLHNLNEQVSFGVVCPNNKTCKTYQDMYGSGQGLCEKMWGSSYKYTKPNTKKDNCMVFWFTPGDTNPNMQIKKDVNAASMNLLPATMLLLAVCSALFLLN